MVAAIAARYRHTPARSTTMAGHLAMLRAGYVLTVAGDYNRLPAALQRWDRAFAARPGALHAVCVGPIAPNSPATTPLVWWRDPLARPSTYHGEWVAWSTVITFALGPLDTLAFPRDAWA
jgi:hypothetical protein